MTINGPSINSKRNKETVLRRPWAYLWSKHDSIMKGAAWKQLLLWQGSKCCNCPSGEQKRLLLENNFSLLATSPPARGRRWFCVSLLRPYPELLKYSACVTGGCDGCGSASLRPNQWCHEHYSQLYQQTLCCPWDVVPTRCAYIISNI